MIELGHRGLAVGLGEEQLACAGRRGVVQILEFEEREILAAGSGEEAEEF